RERINLKQSVAILPKTKNHDRRIVPLPPQVVEMFLRRPAPMHEWFPRWTYNRLKRHMRRAVKQAGLSGVTFHTLRHTFASHAVMSGVDLHTLSRLLGHRTLQMTMRYSHLAPSHLQTATNMAASAIFADHVPRQVPQSGFHTTEEVA